MTFTLETYDRAISKKNSLTSILTLLFFGALAIFGFISVKGFLLGIIIGENTALIMAIILSFVNNKDMNEQKSAQVGGATIVIGFVALFGATIYPYIGEWFIYLSDDFQWLIVIEAIVSFGISISTKIKMLERIKTDREDVRKRSLINKALKNKEAAKMSMATKNILVAIGIWVFGLGTIFAVYVFNN
ncbi:MAG: hypothetical protein AB8B72_13580 [Crocinitomicaceae bacterium]